MTKILAFTAHMYATGWNVDVFPSTVAYHFRHGPNGQDVGDFAFDELSWIFMNSRPLPVLKTPEAFLNNDAP